MGWRTDDALHTALPIAAQLRSHLHHARTHARTLRLLLLIAQEVQRYWNARKPQSSATAAQRSYIEQVSHTPRHGVPPLTVHDIAPQHGIPHAPHSVPPRTVSLQSHPELGPTASLTAPSVPEPRPAAASCRIHIRTLSKVRPGQCHTVHGARCMARVTF